MENNKELPFRIGVGIALLNHENKVFVGKRIDNPANSWQMPQGGVDIISPEKIIFSGNSTISTIPSYEGDMSILKNHISIITFLRPGIIKVKKR